MKSYLDESQEKWAMSPMTLDEADHIVEYATDFLLIKHRLDNDWAMYFSTIQFSRINTAIKLRIATELFELVETSNYRVWDADKQESFQEGLNLYAGLILNVMKRLRVGKSRLKLDPEILSFAEYCGELCFQTFNGFDTLHENYAKEKIYWSSVYEHIGMEPPMYRRTFKKVSKDRIYSPRILFTQTIVAVTGMAVCAYSGYQHHWEISGETYVAFLLCCLGLWSFVSAVIGAFRLRAGSAILDRIRAVS